MGKIKTTHKRGDLNLTINHHVNNHIKRYTIPTLIKRKLWWQSKCPPKDLYMNINSSFVLKSKKTENLNGHQQLNKQTVIYSENGILPNKEIGTNY